MELEDCVPARTLTELSPLRLAFPTAYSGLGHENLAEML